MSGNDKKLGWWITENVYRHHVRVFASKDRKKAGQFFRQGFPDEPNPDANVGGRTVMGHDVYIWVADKKALPALAHEVFHAVSFIMHRVGQPLDAHHDEAYAYLLEYLFRASLQVLGHNRLSHVSK